MNRESGESSMVQEMIGEGHGWWSLSSSTPTFSPSVNSAASSSSLGFSNSLCTPSNLLPFTPWSSESQPQSLSQLLLNGLIEGDERINCTSFQPKKSGTENWEDQLVYPTTNAQDFLCVKQENFESNNSYIYNFHGDDQEIQAFSPRSCVTSSLGNNSMLDFSHKPEQKHGHQSADNSSECFSKENGAPFKKARIQAPPQSSVKVRKEKLGDRITALHQLVSPFGKTDTASVLLESIGYIRFLHGQIEVLSSPYLSTGGSTHSRHQGKEERNCIFPEDPGQLLNDNSIKQTGPPDQGGKEEEIKRDLKSKGLCLVPVSFPLDISTDHIISDYWAPAFGVNFHR
ncbi:hypothetical protein LUZ60_012597 [Juncus effusus]|nr:hypothetical protein LUZ60_012597 [Juncus effusus]